MRKKSKALYRLTAPLALCAALLFGFAAASDAHMYFSFPSDSGKTGQIDVYTTFALNPPTPDESGFGATTYTIAGSVVDPAGNITAIADFPFADSATGKTYTDAELQAMTPEKAEAAVDSRKSTVTVSTGGTSVFLTEAAYVNDETYEGTVYHQDFACTSKAFLNLTSDGASTKAYQTAGLELIPVDDLAEVETVSELKVKALLNGAPLEGLAVYMSYDGCPPNADLHDEISAMRVAVTGSDGIAAIVTPSRAGVAYLFAMYLDPAASTATNFVGAMASLSFVLSAADDEQDVSHQLFKSGGNEAGLGSSIWPTAGIIDLLRTQFGSAWANDLVNTPSGTSAFAADLPHQLPGDETGVTFDIPMDIVGSGLKGIAGTEQMLELTADIVGLSTFDRMVALLKDKYANEPDTIMGVPGYEFYCPYTAKDFLAQFGISVMGRFADGTETDVGDNFMFGALYDEDSFDNGSIFIAFGTLFTDSAPVDGSYALDLTPMVDPNSTVKMPLLYDGIADDKLTMTYWLARETHGGSSSGCSAGIPLGVLLATALSVAFTRKKRD